MRDHRVLMDTAAQSLHPASDSLLRIKRRIRYRSRARVLAATSVALILFAGSTTLLWSQFNLFGNERSSVGDPAQVTTGGGGSTVPPDPLGPVALEVKESVPVAGSDEAHVVIAAFGSLWVSAQDEAAQSLVRFNPGANEVEARIPVVSGPNWEGGGGGLAAGLGRVWVVGQGNLPEGGRGAVLQAVDPQSNAVDQTTPLMGGSAADVALGQGSVWVLVHGYLDEPNVVLRVDPATGEIQAQITIEQEWARRILATPDSILVVAREMNAQLVVGALHVIRIDPSTNALAYAQESTLDPLAVDSSGVWAIEATHDSVAIALMNEQTGQPVDAPVQIDQKVAGGVLEADPLGIWFVGQGDTADSSQLKRYDPASGEVDAAVDVSPGGTVDLAVISQSVWLLKDDGSMLQVAVAPE